MTAHFPQFWDGEGLRCPACESQRLKVKDSRQHKGTTRRRRECIGCGFRWHTMEVNCDIHCIPADERLEALGIECKPIRGVE